MMEENEGNIEFPVRARFNIREPPKVSFKSSILKIFITSLELRKKEEKKKLSPSSQYVRSNINRSFMWDAGIGKMWEYNLVKKLLSDVEEIEHMNGAVMTIFQSISIFYMHSIFFYW